MSNDTAQSGERTELAVVGCTKRKRDDPAPARDLYDQSPLFRRRKDYAERQETWRILSAEHGLVRPDTVLEPYNTPFDDVEPIPWSSDVMEDLGPLLREHDEVTFLVGQAAYLEALGDSIYRYNCAVGQPIRSLPPWEQWGVLDTLLESTRQQRLTEVQS